MKSSENVQLFPFDEEILETSVLRYIKEFSSVTVTPVNLYKRDQTKMVDFMISYSASELISALKLLHSSLLAWKNDPGCKQAILQNR